MNSNNKIQYYQSFIVGLINVVEGTEAALHLNKL